MKCIVNKLAAPIGDADLYKFDELRLFSFVGNGALTPQQGSLTVAPISGESIKISALSGKIYNDSEYQQEIVGELTVTAWRFIYFKQIDNSFILSIIGKSYIKTIAAPTLAIPTSELKYTSAKFDGISFVEGSLNDISYIKVGEAPNVLNISGVLSGDLEPEGKTKLIQYLDIIIGQPLTDYTFLVGENRLRVISLFFRADDSLVSLLGNNPNLRRLNYNGFYNHWESMTLRNTNYTPLSGNYRFATSDDSDRFLINMAACEGTDYDSTKTINLTGAERTSASDAAVASLTARGFTIN